MVPKSFHLGGNDMAFVISPSMDFSEALAEDQMELVLKVCQFCSHPNPTSRPSMRQVMQYQDGDAKLPDIQPDKVNDFCGAPKEISNILMTFPSSLGTNFAQIMSTIDSILIDGR
ncbi:hypothetical protein Ddye_024575 [Dipteronia dyeriana]|uniref:Uncharacterized protein n=1 Tax=Dipteronia dyeriana TaxID=168575 RepID=A0AAD9WUD3_9ROSI|nr:hypothetical protein Ddye_024575 [Dipteronia dyeriana]